LLYLYGTLYCCCLLYTVRFIVSTFLFINFWIWISVIFFYLLFCREKKKLEGVFSYIWSYMVRPYMCTDYWCGLVCRISFWQFLHLFTLWKTLMSKWLLTVWWVLDPVVITGHSGVSVLKSELGLCCSFFWKAPRLP
jgi:hypothetical protein